MVIGEGVKFSPALGFEGVVSKQVVEGGAALEVGVGDLYFWGEEGGVVSMELGGFAYGVSKFGGAEL